MSEAVDQALMSAMVNANLAMDIVYENGTYSEWGGSSYSHKLGVYTPDSNREYCEVRNFPGLRAPYSLSDSDDETGLFQVVVKYPTDLGAIEAKRKAEQIMALFVPGEGVDYGEQHVNIDSKNRDGGRIEGGFYQIVVRINYRAFVPR